MRDACARSVRTIPGTRKTLLDAKTSAPKEDKGRNELVGALDTLKGELSRCQKDFATMGQADQAETVRGYGNDRAVRVQGALRRYEKRLQDFLGLMGINVAPLGAPPSTLAR
jgi:hypothetical protein